MKTWPSLLFLLLLIHSAQAQFTLAYPKGRMELEGWLRVAWNHRFYADDDTDSDYAHNRIYVQRASLKASGIMYTRFEYEMNLELRGYNGLERETGHEDDHTGFSARDLYIGWRPDNRLSIRLGQMKVPFSRKRMLPLYLQSTISRPDLADGFVPGRDRGLLLRARDARRRFTAYAGVFTGNGDNRKYNDRKGRYLLAGRVEIQPFGFIGKDEGDLDHSPRPLLLMGANVAQSHDDRATEEEQAEYLRTIPGRKRAYGGDISLKLRGLFVTAEFDHARFDPEEGADFVAGGWLTQISYAIKGLPGMPEEFVVEPLLAYDEFNPSNKVEDVTQRTLTSGINFLPEGHGMKVMLNWYHRLPLSSAHDEGWKEDEVRLLVQLWIQ